MTAKPRGIQPTKADIGRKVLYRLGHGEAEEGVITSFNERLVFVRFGELTHSMAAFRDELEWTE